MANLPAVPTDLDGSGHGQCLPNAGSDSPRKIPPVRPEVETKVENECAYHSTTSSRTLNRNGMPCIMLHNSTEYI